MKLGDVLQLAKGNLVDIQDNEEYTIAGVQNSGAGVVNRRKVKGRELTMKKYQLIEENQLMWCKVDTKGGAFGVTQKEHIGSLASTNMALAYIDKEKYLPEFISNLFRFKPFHENITKYSTGSTNRKYLTPNQLFEFIEIPAFSVDEQRNWINKLELIQNSLLFKEIERQLALVKELRQAYLREAMQGKHARQDASDEPAEILLEKIKAEKEKLVAEKRIRRDKPLPPISAEEMPFEIPSNWTWCRLGELAEMCLGKMLDQVKNKGELQPYLRNVNVRWGSFDLSDLKEMRFTEDEEERFSAIYGDLIICEGGEPGRAAIWKGEQPIKIQKAVHRVRTNKQALQSEYLYYCLLTDATSKRLNEYFTGGGIQHFTGKSLSKYAIPLPPLAEQERIVANLEKLMKFCDELEANIRQGIANADQLLQTALKEALEPKET